MNNPPPPSQLQPEESRADEPEKNLLLVLFTLYCAKDRLLQITDIERLTLDEQLDLLRIKNIDTAAKRRSIASTLFDKVPDLKQSAHKRIRFKSILSKYSKSCQEVSTLTVTNWTPDQLSSSLLIYFVRQLTNDDATQKDKKQAPAFWKFVFFTHRYCQDKQFDGNALYDFWSKNTSNGTQPGGFQLKFVKLICGEYGLKYGKFASVKKKLNSWFDEAQQLKSGAAVKSEPPKANASKKVAAAKPVEVTKPAASSKKSTAVKPKPKPKVKTEEKKKSTSTAPAMERTMASGGCKWYWMDLEEKMAWIPYRQEAQRVLNDAYTGKKASCVVAGSLRVEFAANGSLAGTQHDDSTDDAYSKKFVVRSEPIDGLIHQWPVAD